MSSTELIPTELIATGLNVLLTIAIAYLFYQNMRLLQNLKDSLLQRKALAEDLKIALKGKEKRGKDIELTEFLADIDRYGFTYIRVDPASVLMRTPKDF